MCKLGAIDGTHISIAKPFSYLENYYYHKFSGYIVVAQTLLDCKKRSIDFFVGHFGSVNDSRVLHRFTLYRNVQYHGLFEFNYANSQHCFHSDDILGARMLWKPKEARILKKIIDQPV
jgi:hypothetical protein